MKRILLTGMSGTGKSTVIAALAARGLAAVDVDDAGWSSPGPDGSWAWDEVPVQAFLDTEGADVAVLSGCADNQVKFYPQFDEVILLSAPVEVLTERLATRTNNPYGKAPDELADVLRYVDTVEPLLRRGASHEVDASASLAEVVAEVLRIVEA